MPVVQKKDKINGDALGTGRRKSSVARVRIRAGKGSIKICKDFLFQILTYSLLTILYLWNTYYVFYH